jgi:hypothetical protein
VLRHTEQSFPRILLVKEREPDNRKGCKNDVISLVDVGFIDRLATESAIKSKEERGQHEKDVFVVDVTNEVRITAVGFATVNHKDVLQEFELSDGIVT